MRALSSLVTSSCALGDLLTGRPSSEGYVRLHPDDMQRLAELIAEQLRGGQPTLGSPGRRLLTIKQAAEELGVPERRVRTLIERGALRARRFGRVISIPAAAIEEFLAGHDGGEPARQR